MKSKLCTIKENKFIEAIKTSYNYKQIIDKLELPANSRTYRHIKEKILILELDINHLTTYGSRGPQNFDYDKLKLAVSKCYNIGQVIEYINGSISGTAYKTIRKYIDKWNLDISHFNDKSKYEVRKRNSYIPSTDIFILGSKYGGQFLKTRLINDAIKSDICEICLQTNMYNGKLLVLQLDHINGNNRDNRVENLRILCPNCHTQTPTWGFKRREPKEVIVKSKKIYNRKNIKIKNDTKWEPYKELVLKSDIDFSKFGWVGKVSKILGITPQKVNNWMKRNMNTFYEENCYKRKNNIRS